MKNRGRVQAGKVRDGFGNSLFGNGGQFAMRRNKGIEFLPQGYATADRRSGRGTVPIRGAQAVSTASSNASSTSKAER